MLEAKVRNLTSQELTIIKERRYHRVAIGGVAESINQSLSIKLYNNSGKLQLTAKEETITKRPSFISKTIYPSQLPSESYHPVATRISYQPSPCCQAQSSIRGGISVQLKPTQVRLLPPNLPQNQPIISSRLRSTQKEL